MSYGEIYNMCPDPNISIAAETNYNGGSVNTTVEDAQGSTRNVTTSVTAGKRSSDSLQEGILETIVKYVAAAKCCT